MKNSSDFFTAEQMEKMKSKASIRDRLIIDLSNYAHKTVTEVLLTRVKDINFETNMIDFLILKKRHLCYNCHNKLQQNIRMKLDKKTGKYICPNCGLDRSMTELRKPIAMPKRIIEEIKKYAEEQKLEADNFLFYRQGMITNKSPPLTRQRVDQIIKELAKKSGTEIEWDVESHRPHIQAVRSGGQILRVNLAESIKSMTLDSEILRDCFPLTKPYRIKVAEAFTTLENRMQNKLGLTGKTGISIVEEAAKRNLFVQEIPSEGDGLVMLYKSVSLFLRNPLHHRKTEIQKEEAMELILFVDYLIKLFEELVESKQ